MVNLIGLTIISNSDQKAVVSTGEIQCSAGAELASSRTAMRAFHQSGILISVDSKA